MPLNILRISNFRFLVNSMYIVVSILLLRNSQIRLFSFQLIVAKQRCRPNIFLRPLWGVGTFEYFIDIHFYPQVPSSLYSFYLQVTNIIFSAKQSILVSCLIVLGTSILFMVVMSKSIINKENHPFCC